MTFFLKRENEGQFPVPKGVWVRKVQVQTKVKMMLSVSISQAEGCSALEELSLIFSELAPLKLYNYQQEGDNSQRPISDQVS